MRVCTLRKAYDLTAGTQILVEIDNHLVPLTLVAVDAKEPDEIVVQVATGRQLTLVADGDVIVLQEPIA